MVTTRAGRRAVALQAGGGGGGTDDEPAYNAGTDTLVYQSNFDSMTVPTDMLDDGWLFTDGTSTQDVTTNAAGSLLLTTGYNGTGKGVMVKYYGVDNSGGSQQEGHNWTRIFSGTNNGRPGHTFYFQYRFKVTGMTVPLDTTSASIFKTKNVEMWWGVNTGNNGRLQFNGDFSHHGGNYPIVPPAAYGGTLFDIMNGGDELAQQVRAPFMYQFDSTWMTATHEMRTNSASGARDGSARSWLNGQLILACRADYAGVTVPGAVAQTTNNKYCTLAQVDLINNNDYIHHLALGSVKTNGLWAFEHAYDDMLMWTRSYP